MHIIVALVVEANPGSTKTATVKLTLTHVFYLGLSVFYSPLHIATCAKMK